MKKLQTKWLPVFVLFSVLGSVCNAQQLASNISSSPSFKNALSFYNTTLAPQLHIFNGKEYQEYARPFKEGQPYFLTNAWAKGTVNFDGNDYENVSIRYNLVTDAVIILNYEGTFKIQLIKEKVKAFSLSGHSFINIAADSLSFADLQPGFYEMLVSGPTALLAKRTKNIQSYTPMEVELIVFAKDHYYLRKNKTYVSITNKRSLLDKMKDKRKEIQQFIKQNKLNFSKNKENAMIKTVEYYNRLTN